jgi:dihydrofolate reductase
LARTQFFGAASLDGFIAEPDGGIGWLRAYEDAGRGLYEEFLAGVGALAMGAATYEALIEQLDSEAWPYADRPTWVFTHRSQDPPDGADVRFVRGPVTAAHAEMRAAAGDANVWVVGGGALLSQFVDAGLLQDLRLTVVPVVLGAGVPLFPKPLPGALELTGSTEVGGGLVELRYELANSG